MRHCLRCAEELPNEVNACENCGAQNDPVEMERLLRLAEFIMVAARHSLPAYARLPRDARTRCFVPDLTEPARWVALAALAGVIGNLSTDAVRFLIKRFRSKASETPSSARDALAEDADRLVQEAQRFFDEFPSLATHVKAAVIEELAVHNALKDERIRRLLRDTGKPRARTHEDVRLSAEDVTDILRSAVNSAFDLLTNPPTAALKGLWDNLRDGSLESDDSAHGNDQA